MVVAVVAVVAVAVAVAVIRLPPPSLFWLDHSGSRGIYEVVVKLASHAASTAACRPGRPPARPLPPSLCLFVLLHALGLAASQPLCYYGAQFFCILYVHASVGKAEPSPELRSPLFSHLLFFLFVFPTASLSLSTYVKKIGILSLSWAFNQSNWPENTGRDAFFGGHEQQAKLSPIRRDGGAGGAGDKSSWARPKT